MLAGGVGAYFLTPVLSEKLLSIVVKDVTIQNVLSDIGISLATINSIIYIVIFLVFYAIDLMICNFIAHAMIKAYRNKSENAAKIKRARSINRKAEKLARKAAWREMRSQYRDNNNWLTNIVRIFLGIITAVIVGLLILMPFGYIGENLNAVNNNEYQYIEEGFDYTLNGVIDNNIEFKVFDWLVGVTEPSVDTVPEEQLPCEHSFIEGVCEYCGEFDIPAEE